MHLHNIPLRTDQSSVDKRGDTTATITLDSILWSRNPELVFTKPTSLCLRTHCSFNLSFLVCLGNSDLSITLWSYHQTPRKFSSLSHCNFSPVRQSFICSVCAPVCLPHMSASSWVGPGSYASLCLHHPAERLATLV